MTTTAPIKKTRGPYNKKPKIVTPEPVIVTPIVNDETDMKIEMLKIELDIEKAWGEELEENIDELIETEQKWQTIALITTLGFAISVVINIMQATSK